MDSDPSLVNKFFGLNEPVTGISFHPLKKQIAASSYDKSVMLWPYGTDETAIRLSGHSDVVYGVAHSPNGRLLATCSRDRTVRLWVNSIQAESEEFKAHSAAVRSVEFNPIAGDKLLTASDDKSVKIWTVHRHKFVSSFFGHTNWVRCARYSLDGRIIASCSDDKSLRLFDSLTERPIHTFHESRGFCNHLSFHPSASCIAVGTSEKKVKIYDIRALKLQQVYPVHEAPVTQVAFHSSGNYLITASQDRSLKIFDLLEARPIYDLLGHDKPVNAVCFSSTGDYFASGGCDNKVFLWKTNFDEIDAKLDAAWSTNKIQKSDDDPITESQSIKSQQAVDVKKTRCRMKQISGTDSFEDKENWNGNAVKIQTTYDDGGLNFRNDVRACLSKIETLTETIILLEKRLSLVEDQLKLYPYETSAVPCDDDSE